MTKRDVTARLFVRLFQDELDLFDSPNYTYNDAGFLVVEGPNEYEVEINSTGEPDDATHIDCKTLITVEPDLTYSKSYFCDEVVESIKTEHEHLGYRETESMDLNQLKR